MVLRIKIQKRTHKNSTPQSPSLQVDCPECKEEIAPDAQFCSHCKAVIVRKYCAGCKELIPDHIAICPYCESEHADKKSTHSFSLANSGIMVGIGVLCIAAIMVWPEQKKEQKVSSPRAAYTPPPASNPDRAQDLNQATETKQPENKNPESSQPVLVPEPAAIPSDPQKAKKIAEGARLNLKGHELIRKGDYQKALPLLFKAVDSFPEGSNRIDYVFAQYNLAHSLRKTGKPEAAIPYLERCLAYDRKNEKFLLELEAARRDVSRKKEES